MDTRSMLVGAGAVVLLAGGIFGAAAYANDASRPAPIVVEPTVKVEKQAAPVVAVPEPVVTPEPEPVVAPEPAPEVVVPEPVVEPAPAPPNNDVALPGPPPDLPPVTLGDPGSNLSPNP